MAIMTVDAKKGLKKVEQSKAALEKYYESLRDRGDKTLRILQDRTSIDTGKTARSWKLKYESVSMDRVSWSVSPEGREKEVGFLEYGTKPHVIEPEDKEALRFEVGGDEVFAKRVYHPGTRPLGFVRRTKDELREWATKEHDKLKTRLKQIWG